VKGDSSQTYGVKGHSVYSAGVLGQSDLASGLEGQGATYGAWLSGAHKKGELLCDSVGQLWFCTSTGSPGIWKKVTLA
jgi:hypothetical protein